MQMDQNLKQILELLAESLEKIYGDKLKAVILYGIYTQIVSYDR